MVPTHAVPTTRSLLTVAALSVLFCLLSGIARGDSKDPAQDLIQSVQIFDALVSFPPASWYIGGDPADSSTFSGGQQGSSFAIRQIPKGQRPDNWTRMYSISGLDLGAGHGHTLDTVARAGVEIYLRICSPKRLFMTVIARDATSFTTLVYCESTGGAVGMPDYGPSTGEIGIVRTFLVRNTVVKAVHSWRGPLFLHDDETTWPVGKDELNATIRRFASMAAYPSGRH